MAEPKDAHGHAHVHGGIHMNTGVSHAGEDVTHTHSHPSWKVYVLIGLVLVIITAIEVAIFYIPQLSGVVVPTLLALSAAKFAIVVMFYMHLRFDSAVFSRVFFAPMFLAVLVIVGMIMLFKVLPAYDVYEDNKKPAAGSPAAAPAATPAPIKH